jgi:hypothetical protein
VPTFTREVTVALSKDEARKFVHDIAARRGWEKLADGRRGITGVESSGSSPFPTKFEVRFDWEERARRTRIEVRGTLSDKAADPFPEVRDRVLGFVDALGEEREIFEEARPAAPRAMPKRVSSAMPKPLPSSAARPRQTLSDPQPFALNQVRLLGGYGFPLETVQLYALEFAADRILVHPPRAFGEPTSIPYSEVTQFSIGGAGKVREGGGFIGGGFGLTGFAIGLAASTALNAATTRTRIETVIALQTEAGELVFLSTSVEPAALELRLAWVKGQIRNVSAAPTEAAGGDVTEKLERLANLLDKGLLDRAEFDALKAKLLSE